ncbi:hypothetical protein PTKIN_Ptkin04bG0080900 [Pterospermum kingtungense]
MEVHGEERKDVAHQGEIMGTLAALVSTVSDPLMVEAVAAAKVLEFARDLGLVRIVLKEGRVLRSSFVSRNFMHTNRDGKKAAHMLAQFGLYQSEDVIWVEDMLLLLSKISSLMT